MSTKIATNIRLPEELLKVLKYKAIEEKKSMNQLIREAIEQSLGVARHAGDRGEDPFEKVIGSVRSGIRDGSLRHDHYLYGKKK